MITVYKYPLNGLLNSCYGDIHRFTIMAPDGAKPLKIMLQNGVPCLWMQVDTAAPMVEHEFGCVGTGFGAITCEADYIDSVVDGDYVWHVYRLK